MCVCVCVEEETRDVPETCAKHKVNEATANPAARAMPIDGGVCPDQGMNAPHMMNIRKKEAKHSATMARQKSSDRISACIGTRIIFGCCNRIVSKRSNKVCKRLSTLAVVKGADTLTVVIFSLSLYLSSPNYNQTIKLNKMQAAADVSNTQNLDSTE